MLRLLRDRPWLLIVLAFVVLIAAWVGLIVFSRKHQMEPVPLATPKSG